MSGKVTVPDDAFLLLGEQLVRLDPQVQPNLGSGVYFKTWTGTVNGVPPTGGGGGGGALTLVIRDSFESQVDPWSHGRVFRHTYGRFRLECGDQERLARPRLPPHPRLPNEWRTLVRPSAYNSFPPRESSLIDVHGVYQQRRRPVDAAVQQPDVRRLVRHLGIQPPCVTFPSRHLVSPYS